MRGCKYGTHRVINKNVLPQRAYRLDNSMNIYDNEILVNVNKLSLNTDSFNQIKEECNHNIDQIKDRIIEIVKEQGKMQYPITSSGGMLIGTVEEIGKDLKEKIDFKIDDKIASLAPLSLTPLRIDEIMEVNIDMGSVEIKGKAILFESGIYTKLPEDLNENLVITALSVSDVAAQTKNIVKEKDSVLILGANNKSGILSCYEARKKTGRKGKVMGIVNNKDEALFLIENRLVDAAIVGNVKNPVDILKKVLRCNNNKEVDVCINCLDTFNTETTSILPVRDDGITFFKSVSSVFIKSVLNTEGIVKDVNIMISNGCTQGHTQTTINALRESKNLRDIFTKLYI